MKTFFFYLTLFMFCSFGLSAQTGKMKPTSIGKATYMREIPALSKMDNIISAKGMGHKAPPKRLGSNTFVSGKGFVPAGGIDPLVAKQKNIAQRAMSTEVASFDAHSSTILNDPTGAIGPNHYVYAFNSGFGIKDRNGNVLMAEASLGTLFPGETLGDPIVVYDNFAERFLIMEFTNKPNGVLVAVSKGPDPVNDGWYTYRFGTGSFPDYVKLSIWSDGYYLTANKNSGGQTNFDVVFALERDKMLVGDDSAGIIGFPLPAAEVNGFYSPGGSHVTGRTLPPVGTGHSILYLQDDSWSGVSSDHIKLWTTDVNWANPDSSTISQPQEISTAPFDSVFDGGSFQNLDEPGSGPNIDAIQATMMYMTNYRRFGTHNSIVFNFTVDIDGGDSLAGIRWYELRQTADGRPWTIHQEGTYTQPNGLSSFCGSIAQDAQGNIGLGYTVVSSSVYTSLRYTGRMASDPIGTMTVAEGVSANGNTQTNRNDGRYGDYSHMTIDPLDDMTFWHIGEYMKNPAPNVRRSHVVAFKLGSNAPDTQAPTAPTNLVASGTTGVQTTLTWSASTDNIGVTGYDVMRDGVVVTTVTATNATIRGLTAGTTYAFSIIAKDAAGNESAASNVISVTTTTTVPDTQAPTTPTNLAASGTTGTQTTLTWGASTDNIGVTAYEVLQEEEVVATVTSTTAIITGLTASTTYTFSVIAKDAAGNESAASNVISVTTTTTVPDTQAPTTPTNLAASGTTGTQTTLTWGASTDNIGVTAYEVLQEEEVVATVTSTTAIITGLTAGTTYAFSVIAKDAAGNESAASNVISVTTTTTADTQPPTAPVNLRASGTTETQTTLTWGASTDNIGVAAYEVFQEEEVVAMVTTTTATITGLTAGTTYTFSVIAKDAAGNESAVSNNEVVTTTTTADTQPPTAPVNLRASGTTETQTTLNWQASTDNVGVTGYNVLQDGDIVAEATGTTATIRGLIKATTYRFSVIAKDAAGNQSTASNGLNVTTLGTTTGPGCTNGLALPHRESFETSFGGWTQSSNDDLNWEPRVNTTPSPDTGPLRAADGNYYLYVEASGGGVGFPNKRAILNSPCFDLSSATSATFSFGYHMFGSPDFGGLAVDASNDGGATWTRVWIRSGNQGTLWQRAIIDLSAFVGGGLQLRFNRLTGGDWRADAAIDAVLLTATSSGPGPGDPGGNCATPNLGLRITFDRFPRQTSWALRNAAGRVIASKRYSNALPPGYTVFEPLNGVPAGDYTFTMYDANGNGLCCFAGPGRYELSSSAGIIASGGQFGASETTRFCVGRRAEATKLVTHPLTDNDKKDSGLFKVFPNPAKDVLNIAVDKIAIQNVEIFSMYGKRVYQGVEKQIDVSTFQAGVYFARITGSDVVITREFAIE